MLASRLVCHGGRRPLTASSIASSRPPLHLRPLPRRRAFHASTRRQLEWYDAHLYVPHKALELLHEGLPWWAAIPVSAFIFRGLLVTTLGAKVRANIGRYVALMPLRHAMGVSIKDRVMKAGTSRSPAEAKRTYGLAFRKENAALDKRWKCPLRGQISWTLLQLPIFTAMAEVIRRMIGTREGLFRMATNAVGMTDSVDPELGYGQNVVDNPWFQPELAHEGILWFTDLTVADPTGILSAVVAGLMLTNVLSSTQANYSGFKATRKQKIIKGTMIGLSIAILPLTQQLPAGLLYYWASSTTSVLLWNRWLDYRYPLVDGLGPCSRQLTKIAPPKTTKRLSGSVRL